MQTKAGPYKLILQGHTWIDVEKTNWIIQAGFTLSVFNEHIHSQFRCEIACKVLYPRSLCYVKWGK